MFSNVLSRLFTFLCHRTEPSFRTPLSPLSFFFPLQELETISSCCLFILTRKCSQKSRGSQCRAMQNGCLKVSASCRHALRVQDNREIARRQWRSVFAYVFRGGCNNVPVGRFHQTRLSSRSGSKTNVQPVESDTERQKGGAVVDELARITQLPALIGSSIAVGLQTPVTDSLVAVSAAARQIERNCNLEINRRLFGPVVVVFPSYVPPWNCKFTSATILLRSRDHHQPPIVDGIRSKSESLIFMSPRFAYPALEFSRFVVLSCGAFVVGISEYLEFQYWNI